MGDSIRGSSDSMSNGGPGTSNSESSSNNNEANKKLESIKLSAIEENPRGSEIVVPTSEQLHQNSNISLVQKVFGGKLQTTYQCSNCKSISLHKEAFTDLHLAFPEKEKAKELDLNVQKLLDSYLKPEILDGENQYHCDQCGNLQVRNVPTFNLLLS